MAESNINKSTSQKNGVEDNNTIAQRFLNIFRQLHVFTPERKQAFDDLILAQTPEIRGMFGKLLGGTALQEYVNELEKKSGVSRSETDEDENEDSKILNKAIENSSVQEQNASVSTLNNSQIQSQLLEMMGRISQVAPTQTNLDTKGLEDLVGKLMRSQSELLANITHKQTEQLSKIITLSLQESYRSSTRSFIEAIREMNHESINAIRETLNYQNNKPIILSNYINNSNPTQVNNNSFDQQGNFPQQQPPAQNFGYAQQNQQLQDLEHYAQNQTKDFETEKNKKKKNKKNKNKKRDDYSFQNDSIPSQTSFMDDKISELDLPSYEEEKDIASSSFDSYQEPDLKGLDYSLFGDDEEEASISQTPKSFTETDTQTEANDDDNYVYEEHYVDVIPEKETKTENRENLKDKILSKAKKLIKGGNTDHLNFDINSIDDIILDPELETEDSLFSTDEAKEDINTSEESIEDLMGNETPTEEWEWVEEEDENTEKENSSTEEISSPAEKEDESRLQTYIHEDDDFINIGEETVPTEEAEDEGWEWVEETEEAEEAEEQKTQPQKKQENEWVWEYDDSENPEEEEWVWEYEELPEMEKSAVDKEPIALEEEYYEPEGKAGEKTSPFSSKGVLEQESIFKFDSTSQPQKTSSKKLPALKPEEAKPAEPISEEQKKASESISAILENLEEPESETLVNIGDISDINLEKKKEELVEDMESITNNFLYNNLNEETDNLDDVYNK